VKRPRWGSGVAAQRAALASLHVAVDQQPSSESAPSSSVKSAASNAKAYKSKEVLKRHLCQVQPPLFLSHHRLPNYYHISVLSFLLRHVVCDFRLRRSWAKQV
jgi:hypothetical protein